MSKIQKEAYVLYSSIIHLSYLLRDGKFHLKTDHKNLKFIGDSANAMVVRWKLALVQYNFDIELMSGAKNVVADYISRLLDSMASSYLMMTMIKSKKSTTVLSAT